MTIVFADAAFVLASELAAARAEIAKLQRVLGKKPLENEIVKEAAECAAEEGMERSHMRVLLGRCKDWTDGSSHRTPSDDAGLLIELCQEIADLPSYGDRRACALVSRQRAAQGSPKGQCQTRLSRHGTSCSAAAQGSPLATSPHARMRSGLRPHAATCDGALMDRKSSEIRARP